MPRVEPQGCSLESQGIRSDHHCLASQADPRLQHQHMSGESVYKAQEITLSTVSVKFQMKVQENLGNHSLEHCT